MTRLRVTSGTTDTVGLASAEPADADAVGASGYELDFISGLPGFHHLRHFVILPLADELQPFSRMQSTEEPGLGFIVFPPGVLFPDYVVEVNEDAVERLHLEADDAVVLAIVALATGNEPPTANLLGPIVVNRANHTALQVVQQGSDYAVAVPLVPSSAGGA